MIIKTGMIGISLGNGHPYSWSAIVNGYDEIEIKKCRFKVIPNYLMLYKNIPLNKNIIISHIWTQDFKESVKIAKASNIPFIAKNLKDLVSEVDCIIFARDDRSFLKKFSKQLIASKKPIFIDKPIATNKIELNKILSIQVYNDQIFSSSFSRFCKETQLTSLEKKKIGNLKKINCIGPKNSKKYLIHLVDPIVFNFCSKNEIRSIKKNVNNKTKKISVTWKTGLKTNFILTGKLNTKFSFEYIGSKSSQIKIINDPYLGFKKSLIYFFKNMYKGTFHKQHNNHYNIVSILNEL